MTPTSLDKPVGPADDDHLIRIVRRETQMDHVTSVLASLQRAQEAHHQAMLAGFSSLRDKIDELREETSFRVETTMERSDRLLTETATRLGHSQTEATARLEHLIVETAARLGHSQTEATARLEQSLAETSARLERSQSGASERFERLLTETAQRFERSQIEAAMRFERSLTATTDRFDRSTDHLDGRIDHLDKRIDRLVFWMAGLMITNAMTVVGLILRATGTI